MPAPSGTHAAHQLLVHRKRAEQSQRLGVAAGGIHLASIDSTLAAYGGCSGAMRAVRSDISLHSRRSCFDFHSSDSESLSDPRVRASVFEARRDGRARHGRVAPARGSASGRPIMALLDLLGRRWTLRVIWELREGPLVFRALQQRCAGMSSSVLNQRLHELRAAAVVELGA